MKKIKKLDFISIKGQKTEKVIIGLHGWQGNKQSFLPMAKSKLFEKFNWYLPEAPYPVNNNSNTKSWSYEKEKDVWEIEEPKRLLDDFFESEIFKNHDSKNIFVVGFSQGALICYEFICKLNKPLGGIFPISGFLRSDALTINPKQNKTPIIIGHGTYDQIISIEQSQKAYELLKKQNANVDLITYNSSHRIPNEMLKIIAEKINN
tara:strand:- start:289 stop:906 length:618 start_codon:yes stop_codon:yes gene_type:complete